MNEKSSIISLGDISKPANTLIEKVSEAVGGIAKPWQIKRVARAEAAALLIMTEAKHEATALEQRGLTRMINEEAKKQENIENITFKAIPHLSNNAKPENIEKDWLTNFFDQCRLTSDEEMQSLWAKILAGEANKPNSFSKRSISIISSLDKKDAELFTKFCTFCWTMDGVTALVFHKQHDIYSGLGINFGNLIHLQDIGLITFDYLSGYKRTDFPKNITIFYYGKPLQIEFESEKNDLEVGKVLLTQAGEELAAICGSTPSEDYYFHVIEHWYKTGCILSSPL